jgi:hypothetical protein
MSVLRWLSPLYWFRRYLVWRWTKDVVEVAPCVPSEHYRYDPLQVDDHVCAPIRRNTDGEAVAAFLNRVESKLPGPDEVECVRPRSPQEILDSRLPGEEEPDPLEALEEEDYH